MDCLYPLAVQGATEQDDGAAVEALRQRGARQERLDEGPAAPPLQGLRAQFHRHAGPQDAAAGQGHGGAPLAERAVDEAHRQAAGRVHPQRHDLDRVVGPSRLDPRCRSAQHRLPQRRQYRVQPESHEVAELAQVPNHLDTGPGAAATRRPTSMSAAPAASAADRTVSGNWRELARVERALSHCHVAAAMPFEQSSMYPDLILICYLSIRGLRLDRTRQFHVAFFAQRAGARWLAVHGCGSRTKSALYQGG